MKKHIYLSVLLLLAVVPLHAVTPPDSPTITVPSQPEDAAQSAKDADKKNEIIKKGIAWGALPAVAFDQDKGFQYGALANFYDFGNGSYYPHPRQQLYIEASAYTKGTQQYFLSYDAKHLIPGVRMSLAATCTYDKAMDFYGLNGYQAFYDYENVNFWKKQNDKTGINPEYMNAFYRLQRMAISGKADFVGNIRDNKLFWQAGYYFNYLDYSPIDRDEINRGKPTDEQFPKDAKTLYEKYIDWGIIPENEKNGGTTSALKVGLMYDTRDFEAAPSRGIWAEANALAAPDFLGTTHPYYRYNVIFRHYLPVVHEKLTFAYRLNYTGTIGNYLPYYIMPVVTTIGKEYDRDGIGGYRTVRGILRDRVQGLDVAYFNTELRWKFRNFILWKQNVYFGLNAFCDGATVTRNYNNSYKPAAGTDSPAMRADYDKYVNPDINDKFHLASGAGFRIAINQNFIIAVDYAMPFKKEDGNGSLYINTGFLF